ncbi:ornithine cyclodeaminase family protein [Neobacillus sp. NPDC097160]|uniref:ornithine cyclodeaminase family protein n=1 Tax=Neobacillus sp. NPDC097160 TaxID=3364298 RepID=UPI003820C6BA
MLLLTGDDVQRLLPMNEAIDVIEEAFITYANQDFVMPERTFSTVKDEDNLLIMPCFVDDCIGLKVVASFPSNHARNSPVTQGLVFLSDIETGDPTAIMNGTTLTAIKTAAVSGVAMRLFKSDAESVGLIGTGLQGLYQLVAAVSATSVKTIYLFNRSSEKIPGFIEDFRELSSSRVEIIPVFDMQELIAKSEVIITATTSLTPVLPNVGELYDHKLIVGVGSYKSNMRELPEELFRRAEYYYIDSEQGKVECGDIIDPIANQWISENQVILLSDLLSGKRKIKQDQNRPVVFKSVSMALFDAAVGNYVYKQAKKNGIGKKFEF